MIRISDMTMKQTGEGLSLSFREKIELAKLLDKLGVSVIELEGMHESRTDALRIKSIAAAVQESIVAVPVELSDESVENADSDEEAEDDYEYASTYAKKDGDTSGNAEDNK